MYYFAYGSNMLKARLEKRVGKVNVIGIGKIVGYQFKVNKISTDGSLKGNAVKTNGLEDYVLGVVFEIDDDKKSKLDDAEGLGHGYDEIDVVAYPFSGQPNPIKAKTYVAAEIDELGNNQPYDWYMAYVIGGAIENGLPEIYVNGLKGITTKKDIRPEKGVAQYQRLKHLSVKI